MASTVRQAGSFTGCSPHIASCLQVAACPPRRGFRATFPSLAKKRDFYEVLGVNKGASSSELKKAYFKLAKTHHPDTNKDDESAKKKFQEASEAYEILSDEDKKAAYDRFGHAGVENGGGGGGGGPGGPGGGFGGGGFGGGFGGGGGGQNMDLNDLFEELFSGRRRGPRRGANMQYNLRLSFLEAVHGCEKPINFQFQAADPATGRAKVETRSTTVEVPAGVESGMTLQVGGQGADGDKGMPRGDLYVELTVDKDRYFKRDPAKGEDVHVEVPITAAQATLGATLDVLTLDGMVELKVPAGSQPGSRLVMRNKGIQRVQSSGRGNQYVHLKLKIPTKLSQRQRELMEEFADLEAGRVPGAASKKSSKGEGAELSGESSSSSTDAHHDPSFKSLLKSTLKSLQGYLKKDGKKAA